MTEGKDKMLKKWLQRLCFGSRVRFHSKGGAQRVELCQILVKPEGGRLLNSQAFC